MFDDWEGFWESLRYSLTPDIISLFRGEWGEDVWNELKMFAFLLICAAIVAGEYFVLTRYVLA